MAAALLGAPFWSGARYRCPLISFLNPNVLPFQLVSSRRIASKLFVGGIILVLAVTMGGGDSTKKHAMTQSIGEPLLALQAGLSFYTSEDTLTEAFSKFGQVVEARIVMDRVSDRPKGFGFVTFASEDEAQNAMEQMNGKVLNGRVIFVDIAKAKPTSYAFPISRGPPDPPSSK